jgi:hypothetical protein
MQPNDPHSAPLSTAMHYVSASENVEQAVGRRREADGRAPRGAEAGGKGVVPLEAEVEQKQDDVKQPANIIIDYNVRASIRAEQLGGRPA